MDDKKPWPKPTNPTRRKLVIATSAVGGVAAVGTAIPFILSMSPSERARRWRRIEEHMARWRTSWRAATVVGAKPARKTKL